MGAEQSSAAASSQPPRSQRDEDIPYTTYAISKPISADVPTRSSPRLRSGPGSRGGESRDASVSGRRNIIVVTEGVDQSAPRTDPACLRLDAIPSFLPLLHTVTTPTSASTGREGVEPRVIDARYVLALCARYQEHLRQCAETVAFDQNALCARIKEVDVVIQTLYNQLTERQKRFSKYADQMQKVQEMNTMLSRIQMNIEQTIPLVNRLNSALPAEDQLESFSLNS